MAFQVWRRFRRDNIDALNLGHDAVFSGAKANTAAQVQQTLAGMGPGAQDYYRKGVAEALIHQTRTNGVNGMRQLLRNEDVQDKVQLAFGNDPKGQAAYDNFLDAVKQRVSEQNINSQITQNSRTYARQAARTDLETQPLHPLDVIPHAVEIGGHGVGLLAGNPASAAALSGKALKAVMANFPRADRSVVGNPLTNALLGRAPSATPTLWSRPSMPGEAEPCLFGPSAQQAVVRPDPCRCGRSGRANSLRTALGS